MLSDDPGVGRIGLCSNQCVHFSVGPVTLNLSPMAFAEAAVLVRNAMNGLSKLIPLDEPARETRSFNEDLPRLQ